MNADSRKTGKGAKRAKPLNKRRIVKTSADAVAKVRTEAPTPKEPSAPSKTREELRAMGLDELCKLVPDAVQALGRSVQSSGRGMRGAGQRSSDAKWLLERVLQLVGEPPATDEAAAGAPTQATAGANVASLAERRAELHRLYRQQREQQNK